MDQLEKFEQTIAKMTEKEYHIKYQIAKLIYLYWHSGDMEKVEHLTLFKTTVVSRIIHKVMLEKY